MNLKDILILMVLYVSIAMYAYADTADVSFSVGLGLLTIIAYGIIYVLLRGILTTENRDILKGLSIGVIFVLLIISELIATAGTNTLEEEKICEFLKQEGVSAKMSYSLILGNGKCYLDKEYTHRGYVSTQDLSSDIKEGKVNESWIKTVEGYISLRR